MSLSGALVSALIRPLSSWLREPVIDGTELKGKYSFEFRFPSRQAAFGDLSTGSIFTALQEQLGLRLESEQVTVESIVVDYAERPDPI